MREWSKLDTEADTIINNVLTVFDGNQKGRNNAVADSENETILENINRESVIFYFFKNDFFLSSLNRVY